MIDYAAIRQDADEAITNAGQAGFLRRPVAGIGTDPWNPGSGASVSYPIMFVLTDYAELDRDGTLIQQNDQKALIRVGTLPVEPATSDQLVDSKGRVFEIVSLRPLEPGGVVLLYTAQVRR